MLKSCIKRIVLLLSVATLLGALGQHVQAQNLGNILRNIGVQVVSPPSRSYPPRQTYPVNPPATTYPQPTYPPTNPPQATYPPTWDPNPVVVDSGKQLSGISYDPFSGQVRVRTDQGKLRESYFDANRNSVDPGSYRRVDRVEVINGQRYHVTGHEWTTNGKPHGNLSRRSLQRVAPGVVEDKNEYVGFGANAVPRAQQPARRNTVPQRGTPKASRYSPF